MQIEWVDLCEHFRNVKEVVNGITAAIGIRPRNAMKRGAADMDS